MEVDKDNTPSPLDSDPFTVFDDTIFGKVSNVAIKIVDEHSESLVDIVTSPEVMDLAGEIPILKIAIRGYKLYGAMREQAELKKLVIFLNEMQSVSDKQRISFLKKYDYDPKFRKKTVERLLLLIQKLDEPDKARIVGRLFKNYMLQLIDTDTYYRLASAVERSYLADLILMRNAGDWNNKLKAGTKQNISKGIDDPVAQSALSQVGLMDFKITVDFSGYSQRYNVSNLGRLLYQYGLSSDGGDGARAFPMKAQ